MLLGLSVSKTPRGGLLIDAPIRINLTTCQNTFLVIGHCFEKQNKTGLVSGLSSHKHIHTERELGRASRQITFSFISVLHCHYVWSLFYCAPLKSPFISMAERFETVLMLCFPWTRRLLNEDNYLVKAKPVTVVLIWSTWIMYRLLDGSSCSLRVWRHAWMCALTCGCVA